ncbi:MAG: metallophosphoesterase, partial [Ignavibacteriales bacterium]|nr:metallophosphoesterase [Ignavibacteriales bacterium]
KESEKNKRRGAIITVASLLFISVYSGAVIFKDTWTVRIVEHEIELPSQFSSLAGLRIVQISDVQGDGRTTEHVLINYVNRVNALRPDFIFFAGDVVTGGERYIESTTNVLGKLKSRYGVIAAVGDHDFFSNKVKVIDGLRRNGVLVVEDSTVYFAINGSELAITGITYTYRARPSAEQLSNATGGSLSAYRVLLVHQPAMPLVSYAADKHYNLFVAGHTHGGGLAFGIPGLFLFAPSSVETRYLSGLYKAGEMVVSVTNGLGFTLAPIRFHAPAEITVLTLTKE